jgi:hypothetical protein
MVRAGNLPYFKFEAATWDSGNIQLCSKQSKGLFIDLCSLYWIRKGELPYALALQKHCNGDASVMQELLDNEIILVNDGHIVIQFLDEQLNGFIQISDVRSDAANKRWNAIAMQMQCKSNAIREEKIRGDKIKGDKYSTIPPTIEDIKNRIIERGITKFTAEKFHAYYSSNGWMVGKNKMKNWDSALTTWNSKDYENTSGTGKRNTKRVNDYWNTPGGEPAV